MTTIYTVNLYHIGARGHAGVHKSYFTEQKDADSECIRQLEELKEAFEDDLGVTLTYRFDDPRDDIEDDLGTHCLVDEDGDVIVYMDLDALKKFERPQMH